MEVTPVGPQFVNMLSEWCARFARSMTVESGDPQR